MSAPLATLTDIASRSGSSCFTWENLLPVSHLNFQFCLCKVKELTNFIVPFKSDPLLIIFIAIYSLFKVHFLFIVQQASQFLFNIWTVWICQSMSFGRMCNISKSLQMRIGGYTSRFLLSLPNFWEVWESTSLLLSSSGRWVVWFC